jgi:hypothetical protein
MVEFNETFNRQKILWSQSETIQRDLVEIRAFHLPNERDHVLDGLPSADYPQAACGHFRQRELHAELRRHLTETKNRWSSFLTGSIINTTIRPFEDSDRKLKLRQSYTNSGFREDLFRHHGISVFIKFRD